MRRNTEKGWGKAAQLAMVKTLPSYHMGKVEDNDMFVLYKTNYNIVYKKLKFAQRVTKCHTKNYLGLKNFFIQ